MDVKAKKHASSDALENGPAPQIDLDAGRRAFIRSIGLGTAGLAVFGAGAGIGSEASAQQIQDHKTISDADILNFALNLEYLEAEFYLRAAFGRGLRDSDTDGVGRRGRVHGGRKVDFETKDFRLFAEEIANDEEAHVKFLRAALGDARVARPKINIDESFAAAAQAAGLGQGFDAYANEVNFLIAAFVFEDVGVTAYKGAARLLDNKDVLEAAAGILAVEAYHAGAIRTILFRLNRFFETRQISWLRDRADGPDNNDQPIGNPNRANIVPADENGLAFGRSTEEVLRVVYLGARNEGGFFPDGVNGAIQ